MKRNASIGMLFLYTLIIYTIIASCMLTSCSTTSHNTSACSQVWMPSYTGERNPKTIAFVDSIHKQDSIMGRYPFNK
jgi:hypothetical protein